MSKTIINLTPDQKLLKDLKRRLTKDIAITAIDVATLAVNPVIAYHVSENIESDYGKKAIAGSSAILFLYQLNKILADTRVLRRTLTAYTASVKIGEQYDSEDENQVINVIENIDLPSSEWIVRPEDIIVENDDTSSDETASTVECDEDGYVKGGFEYIVHIGEDVPYDDDEDEYDN